MILFAFNNISNELLIVYSLIGIVLVLIGVILLVDHFSNRKKDDFFDNKKLAKKLKYLEEEKESFSLDEPVVPVQNLKVEEETIVKNEIEEELGKTQAQIDVEEITRALEKAQAEERVDPYLKFEEEQEQNAIISYSELAEKFDQLYDEGEKIQYIEDDSLPIDLDELYQKNEQVLKKTEPVVQKTITLKDMGNVTDSIIDDKPSGFRSSPVISPVYGIQREVPVVAKRTSVSEIDDEIRRTNEFLKTLKELKKNLD